MENDGLTCASCPSDCSFCDGNRCTMCSSGKILNLQSYRCELSCPKELQLITFQDGTQICRPWQFFIDPESDTLIELGTFEYPYKVGSYAYNMLINGSPYSPLEQVPESSQIQILLKEGTEYRFNLMEERWDIIGQFDILIGTYDPSTGQVSDFKSTIIYDDFSLLSTSEFVPYHDQIVEPDWQMKMDKGELETFEFRDVWGRMTLFRSNIIIQNLNFTDITLNTDDLSYAFRLFGSPNNKVKYYNINFSTIFVAIATYEGYLIEVYDSQIDVLKQYFINSDLGGQGCILTATTGIRIENSIFYNYGSDSQWYMIGSAEGGDLIVRNNTFYDFNFGGSNALIQYYNSRACSEPVITIDISQNYFDGSQASPILDIYMVSEIIITNQEVIGTQDFVLKYNDNVFVNTKTNYVLLLTQSSMNLDIEIMNNYFDNNTLDITSAPYSIQAAGGSLKMGNTTFANTAMSQIVSASIPSIEVTNTLIQNVTKISSGTQNYLVQADDANMFKIQNLTVLDSDISTGGVVWVQSVQEVDFVDINVVNSTVGIAHLLRFNLVQSGSVSDLTVLNIFSGFSNPSLIYINLIETSTTEDKQLLFDTIQIEKSEVTVFQIHGAEGGQFSATVSIRNVTAKDLQMSTIYPIFYFGEYESSQLTVKIEDSKFSEIEANIIEIECNSDVEIINCMFDMIKGKPIKVSALKIEPQFRDGIVYMHGSNFTNINGGSDALITTSTKSQMHIFGSSFINNYSNGRGSIMIADQVASVITVTGSHFEKNAALKGGVAYTHRSSSIQFNDSVFLRNYAVEGGVIYANDDGTFSFTNCYFDSNSAQIGNVIFMINSSEESFLTSCQFNRNLMNQVHNLPDSIVQASANFQSIPIDVPINMQKSILVMSGGIEMVDQANMIQASVSAYIYMTDLVLRDIETNNFILSTDSNLILENVLFDNILSTDYLFILPVGCIFNAKNWELKSSTALIMRALVSTIIFDDVKVDLHTCIQNQKLIELSRCDGSHIYNSEFFNITNECELFHVMDSQDIRVEDVSAHDIQGIVFDFDGSQGLFENYTGYNLESRIHQGLALLSVDSKVSIKDSYFYDIQSSSDGAAISAQIPLNSQAQGILLVENSRFERCHSNNGGAIISKNTETHIKTSQFTENIAKIKGGAVFLTCEKSHLKGCPSHFESTTFELNEAGIQGGGIDYDLHPPTIASSVIFTNNVAQSGYGNDIASYAAYMTYTNQDSIWMESVSVTSGQNMPADMEMAVYDWDGNIVTTLESTLVNLGTDFESIGLLSIEGQFSFQTQNGIVSILASDISFKATQGAQVGIVISTTAVDAEIYHRFNSVPSRQVTPHIDLSFGECNVGDIFKDLECVECPIGEFILELNQIQCLTCPAKITCPGGAVLETDAGHWRSDSESMLSIKCLAADACLGGQQSECAVGYEGVLCHECTGFEGESYYGRQGLHGCIECGSTSTTILVMILLLLVALVYVIVMMVLIIRGVHSEKDHSVLLRIITNYFQVLLLVYNLDLQWPENIQRLFESITLVSSASNNIIQIGCLWQEFEGIDMKISLVSLSLIFFAFLPFVIALITLSIWRALAVCKRSFRLTYRRNAISMSLIFVFLLYPSIVANTFQMFDCIDIEGTNYLRRDFSIECWSKSHITQIFAIAIPTMVIWILGFPLVVFLILRKYKQNLEEPEMIIKYGLFYIGLNTKGYYWEIIVVNIRKVLFIAITVSLSQQNQKLVVLLCSLIVLVTLQMIKRIKPYKKEWLNFAENFSLQAAVFSMLFGFMLLEPSTHNQETGLLILFICITLVNAAFLFYFTVRMIMVIYGKYRIWKKKRKIAKKGLMDQSLVQSAQLNRTNVIPDNSQSVALDERPSMFAQDEEIKTEENQGIPNVKTAKSSRRGLIPNNKFQSADETALRRDC